MRTLVLCFCRLGTQNDGREEHRQYLTLLFFPQPPLRHLLPTSFPALCMRHACCCVLHLLTGKNVSFLAASASRAAIHNMLSVKGNLADMTAKSGAQTILACMIGENCSQDPEWVNLLDELHV